MPFQFSEGGVPYHQPVAPELPGRVNIPQGDFVGNSIVNAFVHRAIASERAQLEQQQILQQADLQAQRLAYQDKWQQMDHNIAQQNADSLNSYRQKTAQNYLNNKADRDAKAAAKLQAQEEARGLVESAVGSVHEFEKKSIPAAKPIMNQERILSDPGGTLADIGAWMQQYEGTKVGATPAIEKQLKDIAAKMEVPIVPNANYVDSKGNETLVDKNDPLAWRVPAGIDEKTQSAVWRGVQPSDVTQFKVQTMADQYADPLNRRKIANQLIAAGHGMVEKTEETSGFDIWHPIVTGKAKTGEFRKKTTVTHTPTLDPWANKLLLKLGKKRTTFQSEVPDVARAPLKKWQILAGIARGNPVGGVETGMESGMDDVDADRARMQQAIAMNPAAEEAIKQHFKALHPDEEP